MRLHLILTCWGFLPQNLHHKTDRFAHFLTSPEFHNLTQPQKNTETPLWFWFPAISRCVRKLREASGRLSSQSSMNIYAEPGAHAFFMGGSCHASKSPKAFLRYHWLDISGLATQECGGYFLLITPPHSFSTVICPPCAQAVATPCGQNHSASSPREDL